MDKKAEIGKILRLFREKTNQSMQAIAQKAGISKSMLSQIERGTVSPSIDTLFSVCQSLDLDIGELFHRISEKKSVRIFHPGERIITKNEGILYEQLVTSYDQSHPAELFLIKVEPGSMIGISGQGHEGIEMGYIIEGQAHLTINKETYEISQGDSIWFAAHLPHRLENPGEKTFAALWSVAPPHKDYFNIY